MFNIVSYTCGVAKLGPLCTTACSQTSGTENIGEGGGGGEGEGGGGGGEREREGRGEREGGGERGKHTLK